MKYLQTLAQFGGLIGTLFVVSLVNLNFRFHRSLVAEHRHGHAQSSRPLNVSPDAASIELQTWRTRKWMAPRRVYVFAGILLSLLFAYGLLNVFVWIRLPSLVKENAHLATAKQAARQNCTSFVAQDDLLGAYNALLRSPAVLSIRLEGEEKRRVLQQQFPSVAVTIADYAESLIRQCGPMAPVLPLLFILVIRYLLKPRAAGANDKPSSLVIPSGTDSAWWTMTEELCSMVTTIVTVVATGSFLFFHLYVDGQRVNRCIHTSGHWYTWASSCCCFSIAVGVLGAVAFAPPHRGRLEGTQSHAESDSIATGLSLTVSSVARSLFYFLSLWFALYMALTLPALRDSQSLYHDTADAMDGIRTATTQLILAAILAPIGVIVYASLRDSQFAQAIVTLESLLNSMVKQAHAQLAQHNLTSGGVDDTAPPQNARVPDLHTPVSSSSSSSSAAASSSSQSSSSSSPPVAPPLISTPVPTAPSFDSAPPPPPPPPSGDFAPAPSTKKTGGLDVAELKGKKLRASASGGSASKTTPGGGEVSDKPTPELLLAQIAKMQQKKETKQPDAAIPLDSGIPAQYKGDMMLMLQYKGARHRLNMDGSGSDMKAALHRRANKESQLRTLCSQHNLRYVDAFPDLALHLLAIHFREAGALPTDAQFKCLCQDDEKEDDEWKD